MIKLPHVDSGHGFDWGRTSDDYAKFRQGPPLSFYKKLAALDIGTPSQRILDLGTGTGILARQFALQACHVSASDISPEQIIKAKELATEQNLEIDFQVAAAESQPFSSSQFEAITANQCWLYFDKSKVIPEVKRLLKPGGVLMIGNFNWLPRQDKIARLSESLVLQFNPQWSSSDFSGDLMVFPPWAEGCFQLKGMFYYDEAIPYTRAAWRGRFRACRGVSASLDTKTVEEFDLEHEKLLKENADETFTVLHRLHAHIFTPLS